MGTEPGHRPSRNGQRQRTVPPGPRALGSPGGSCYSLPSLSASCSGTSCTRPVWVFFIACLGVLPLAGLMGEATEHLAHRTGPTIGGLLNATFGNAAELIIAIVALRAGLVDLVKASITGSILGNLLLILGPGAGRRRVNRQELRFNRTNAGMSAGMLALSVVGLVFPALFHSVHPEVAARVSELHMSEAVAVILILTYRFSLLFTLRTHRSLFGVEAHPIAGPVWSRGKAVAILAAATVGVAVESELLVQAATEAHRGARAVPDVPRPDRHSDHRQRRRTCRRGDAVPARDRSIWHSRSPWARAPRSRCWWRRCWCSSARCWVKT